MLETKKTELVLIGCGAMALEAAAYIDDINFQLSAAGGRVTVSGVFSTEFSRKNDIETVLGYEISQYDDFDMIEGVKTKNT
jgi:thioredoxin reductase